MKSQPLLCVPVRARTQAQAMASLKDLKGKADLAELWLDTIRDLDLSALLRHKSMPVICRGTKAPEAGRLGADYIDLPWNPKQKPPRRGGRARTRAKLILSYHDFKRTPPSDWLLSLALRMRRAGANIVKIATFARSFSDTFRMILLARELEVRRVPHILIAMGPRGRLSRVITPHLGGTIMFAPLKKSKATAPGQLTLDELKKAWNLLAF